MQCLTVHVAKSDRYQFRGAPPIASVSETLSDGSRYPRCISQPLLVLPPRGSQPHEVSSRRSDRDESSGGVQPGGEGVSSETHPASEPAPAAAPATASGVRVPGVDARAGRGSTKPSRGPAGRGTGSGPRPPTHGARGQDPGDRL